MSLEQTVKDLQAQNAQFQQMFLTLTQGQEDLKALIVKKKAKKAKKPVRVLSVGRRRPANRALDFATPSKRGDNQDEDDEESQEGDNNPASEEDEPDYIEEQYPPAGDKYKWLEDRLNAMEIQRVPSLDFEELGLVPGVVIPHKFKVLIFAKT